MKKVNEIGILLLMVFFIGFIADIFFIVPIQSYKDWGSDARLFILLILWIIVVKVSRFTSIATFRLTLLFLAVLSFLFIFFREYHSTERVASWVYIYLATGVIQQLFEARRKS